MSTFSGVYIYQPIFASIAQKQNEAKIENEQQMKKAEVTESPVKVAPESKHGKKSE